MEYNEEATRELEKKPVVVQLTNWLKENGCIFDKVQWPAVFGNGLVGCRLLEDVQPFEAFLYVPSKCWMSIEHAKRSEIGQIYTSHDSMFVSNYDRDQMILVLFLMYEALKGQDSFWYPYIQYLEDAVPTAYWNKSILKKSDYEYFNLNIHHQEKKYEEEWDKLKNLVPVYPQFFPEPEKFTKELYLWTSHAVTSRVFGWGSPTTILVPLADFLNHSTTNSVQINTLEKNLHKEQNKIYLYNHNFDKTAKSTFKDEDIYLLETSKLKVNCARLFKEDEDVPKEVVDSWVYKPLSKEE